MRFNKLAIAKLAVMGAAGSIVAVAALTSPALAACTRLGFTVNDYGKDGPTRDAKNLLDKYIAKWTAEKGIKSYKTGPKSVKCELFLDVGFFDEHTCRAEASVCWEGPAVPGMPGVKSGAAAPVDGMTPKPEKPKAAARAPEAVPETTPAATTAVTPAETPAATIAVTPAETPAATTTVTPAETPAASTAVTHAETPAATTAVTPAATPAATETGSITNTETPSTPASAPDDVPAADAAAPADAPVASTP